MLTVPNQLKVYAIHFQLDIGQFRFTFADQDYLLVSIFSIKSVNHLLTFTDGLFMAVKASVESSIHLG